MNTVKILASIILLLNFQNLFAQQGGSRYLGNSDDRPVTEDRNSGNYIPLKLYSPDVPETYTLFEEKVPLQVWDVRERFDRELLVNTYMQGSTIYILKLYRRWMPMIEEKLKANGVPDDFKYLCVAESALQNQVSSVGASGFWQFMKGTAPQYGLEVNEEIDERYNVAKATDAACAYLKDAYNTLGSWTAAAASYNCGVGGYRKAATEQGSMNFYDLLLHQETMRYIFRIMALKYILENPSRSGFNILTDDTYKPLRTRKEYVTTTIPSLINYAEQQGTNYKTIKMLNPWLRGKSLPNRTGKTYELLLPAN